MYQCVEVHSCEILLIIFLILLLELLISQSFSVRKDSIQFGHFRDLQNSEIDTESSVRPCTKQIGNTHQADGKLGPRRAHWAGQNCILYCIFAAHGDSTSKQSENTNVVHGYEIEGSFGNFEKDVQ